MLLYYDNNKMIIAFKCTLKYYDNVQNYTTCIINVQLGVRVMMHTRRYDILSGGKLN